ncbi:hypothetical protein AKG36_04445 [Trueperella bernardiae]|nr:hypothetical protein AKG36_04445 [Trueperella bernardiae]
MPLIAGGIVALPGSRQDRRRGRAGVSRGSDRSSSAHIQLFAVKGVRLGLAAPGADNSRRRRNLCPVPATPVTTREPEDDLAPIAIGSRYIHQFCRSGPGTSHAAWPRAA